MILSIITISYNNIEGLKRTVKSVLDQSKYDEIEYIIIDGGSKDGTYEYLSTLPQSVKWISEKDRGISHAFNKGINLATGETILCLNSGDSFINKNVIERVIKDWNNYNVDILSYRVIVSDGIYIPASSKQEYVYETCTEPHQGTFVKKDLYDKIGFYSEEYNIRMDFHFFARSRNVKASFKYINECIVKYEEGGTSMQLENRVRFWKEGLAVKLQYGLKISFKDIVKMILYRNND